MNNRLKKSGKSWRGSHLVFDYGANTVAFGSDISDDDKPELRARLEMVTGAKIRHGEALPQEINTNWEADDEIDPDQRPPLPPKIDTHHFH